MGYTSNWKKTVITNERFVCPKCDGKDIKYRDWESPCGGYDDVNYKCSCGKEWWVEGADS